MRRTVVLQHDLPSGEGHLDWLIQVSADPADRVLTFRTQCRPDDRGALVFTAERIGDHRPFYLEHQGPVSGGRGVVTRLGTGVILSLEVGSGRLRIEADFGNGATRLWGEARSGGVWVFERLG